VRAVARPLLQALRLFFAAAAALVVCFCATAPKGPGAPQGAIPSGKAAVQAPAPGACRVLARGDLDHVIDGRLSRAEAARFLSGIAVKDYDIADAGTNWLHGAIPGAPQGWALYYLTYRERYIIMILKDRPTGCADVLDVLVIPRRSDDYELGMGPVTVDGDHTDPDVIVLYNRHWNGNSTDDIIGAYKPNFATGKLEVFAYRQIRIDKEE